MKNDPPEKALHVRKYFEASLSSLAEAMDCKAKDFRCGFKYALRLMREIDKSTDELPLEILERVAKAIADDARKLNEPPPPEHP